MWFFLKNITLGLKIKILKFLEIQLLKGAQDDLESKIKKLGPTEIRTRIVGFKVQSDSHYTIRPCCLIFYLLFIWILLTFTFQKKVCWCTIRKLGDLKTRHVYILQRNIKLYCCWFIWIWRFEQAYCNKRCIFCHDSLRYFCVRLKNILLNGNDSFRRFFNYTSLLCYHLTAEFGKNFPMQHCWIFFVVIFFSDFRNDAERYKFQKISLRIVFDSFW